MEERLAIGQFYFRNQVQPQEKISQDMDKDDFHWKVSITDDAPDYGYEVFIRWEFSAR